MERSQFDFAFKLTSSGSIQEKQFGVRSVTSAGQSAALIGNLTIGLLLRIQVEGNLTRARKISPVNVAAAPLLENPVMEVILPVALIEFITKVTTSGSANAAAMVSCET